MDSDANFSIGDKFTFEQISFFGKRISLKGKFLGIDQNRVDTEISHSNIGLKGKLKINLPLFVKLATKLKE